MNINNIDKNTIRAEDMTQWVRVCGALAEDPSLVPRTRTRWFKTNCSSISRGSDSSSGLQCIYMHMYGPTHRQGHILKIK